MKTIPSKIILAAGFVLALAFTFSCSSGDDTSGGGSCNMNGYKKVEMPDGKTWMAENLNCDVEGSVCYDPYCTQYGRLYNWEAAKKACSGGWHLPSNTEWEALLTSVGGDSTAGKHLKAREGWIDCGPSGSGAENSCEDTYGFAALPGGFIDIIGLFWFDGEYSSWWSSSEYSAYNAYSWDISNNWESVSGGDININKNYLFSVRCVQN